MVLNLNKKKQNQEREQRHVGQKAGLKTMICALLLEHKKPRTSIQTTQRKIMKTENSAAKIEKEKGKTK